MSITLFALSGALIAASSGMMAFIMFALGRGRLPVLWGAFCITVGAWGVGAYLIGSTDDPLQSLVWWKLTHIGIAFIPATFIHFIIAFTKRTNRYGVVLAYVTAGIFSVLAVLTPHLINSVRFVFGEFYYDSPPTLIYFVFISYFCLVTAVGHALLYKKYQSLSGTEHSEERKRIVYFALATLIGFLGGGMSFLPVFGFDIYPIGNFAVVLYPIIVGYAILRHHLFDMRVATANGLIFLLWVFVGVRTLISPSPSEFIPNMLLFISVVLLGIFLVRSINKEQVQRETVLQQEAALKAATEEVYKHSLELVHLKKELESANAKQENLLHFISHEVKGYLTRSAAAFSGLLEGDYGTLPSDAKQLADKALEETRKGVDTVMDILDAGNFKKGTLKLAHEPFDVRASVEKTVNSFKPAAADKHVSIIATLEGGKDFTVVGDETQIRKHVIGNLIDNAIRYTPRGRIVVTLKRENDRLLFSVQDSGIGITEEDMKHLFTEGGRGAESVKVNVHSTGYGLFIAKSIVTAHGGRIWAESDGRGKGSTFFVELPVAGSKTNSAQ